MKKYIKKYPKSFIATTILIVVIIIGSLYYTVRKNFDKIVDVSLKTFLADISHSTSDLSTFGVIIVNDAVLKDDKGITILYTKELLLKYSIKDLLRGKISEISAKDPYLYIATDKNYDINIVDIFATGSPGKAGVGVPIDIITVTNARVLFQDNYYEQPINMFVNNVDGYVSFDKTHGIDLRFYNTKGDKKVDYSFNNYEKEYSMTIKLKGYDIDQKLMQYAYVDEYTNYLGGKANLDLTIDTDGLWGTAYLSEASFKTKAYDGIATDIHGGVDFLGDNIRLKLKGKMGEKDVGFGLNYSPDGVNMNITTSDLDKTDIDKVTLLEGDLKEKLNKTKNLHVTYLRLNFDFNKDFDLTLDTYLRLDPIDINGIKIDDFKGRIILENEKVYLKDIRFKTSYRDLEAFTILNGEYTEENLNLTFDTYNKKSPLQLKKIKGEFKYNLKTENINYKLHSHFLNFSGGIDLNSKIFRITSLGMSELNIEYENELYDTKNNINIIYDYSDKKLLFGSGDIDVKKENSTDNIQLSFTNSGNKLNFEKLKLNYKDLNLTGRGYLDLDDFSYNFKYSGKNFKIENFFPTDDLETRVDIDGEVSGKKEIFNSINEINSISGKYNVEYKNIKGHLKVDNEDGLSADFDGSVGELKYTDFEFKDIKLKLFYKDGTLKVTEFRNNLLTIEGDYNIINETIDFYYKINGIRENKIKVLEKNDVKINLENISGSMAGTTSEFNINVESSNAWIQYKDLPKIYLKGNINYRDNKFYFNEFKASENNITGYYNLKDNDFRFKINILSNNLPEYYGGISLKYRLTGELLLWGSPNDMSGILEAHADNVYLRGEKLPNLKLISTYKGGNLNKINSTGHIDVNQVTIYSESGYELLNGSGWIDLAKEELSFNIQDTLELREIKKYVYTDDLEGKLDAKIKIGGKFNNLNYNLSLASQKITVANSEFDNIDIKVSGDTNEFKLDRFHLNYKENELYSHGNINLKSNDYKFFIKSNEINLVFLNIFEFSENIKDIEGIATIDVEINSKNNYGNFKIEDFSAKLPRYGININKVNTEVDLNKRLVEINNFDGYINNGKIKMEGYLKIPTIAEIRTKEILSKLDYELSLKLDSVDYSYEDKINLVFSANALFAKNKITGEFIVDSGEILDIPEVDEGEISNLASQIKEKEVIKKSRELGKAFEIKTSIKESNSIDLDIKLKTKEPINLNINKLEVTSVVEDIKGNLIIDGNLKLKDDEISYNGILSIEDGSIKLNSNLFYLTTATVNFRKTETESVEFKPLITLNANSTIANEEVYINIDGEYPDLEIQMSSGSGLSEDDIGSLITFHNVNDDESNSNNAVKDVIDRESGKLFSPISSEIASVLKIDKFKISSDLVASEYQAGVYKDTGSLGLGASVEAENPIYKEKLYWRAKARWGTSKYYSNVTEYDFSVIHRITEHLSWGLGVGKIPEGRKTHGETLINNHIDLTWRKKYKSLEDVLLSLLLLGGEE